MPFGPDISWPNGFRRMDPEARNLLEGGFGGSPQGRPDAGPGTGGSRPGYLQSATDDYGYGDPGYSDPSYDGPRAGLARRRQTGRRTGRLPRDPRVSGHGFPGARPAVSSRLPARVRLGRLPGDRRSAALRRDRPAACRGPEHQPRTRRRASPTPSSGTDIRAWMTRGPRPTRGWRACATTSCATRSRRPASPATTSRLTTSRGTPNWVAARPPTRSSRTAGPPGISVAATSAASATPVASATASALGRPRPGDSRRRPGTARVAARVSRVAGTPGWVPASRPVPGPVPPGKIPRAISELPPRRSGCSPRPRPGGSRSRPNTQPAGTRARRRHRAAASPSRAPARFLPRRYGPVTAWTGPRSRPPGRPSRRPRRRTLSRSSGLRTTTTTTRACSPGKTAIPVAGPGGPRVAPAVGGDAATTTASGWPSAACWSRRWRRSWASSSSSSRRTAARCTPW